MLGGLGWWGGDGEPAGVGDGGDVDIEELAGEELCGVSLKIHAYS